MLINNKGSVGYFSKNVLCVNKDLIRSDSVMYLLNANFTCTYVTTFATPVIESRQSKFTQVPVLHARTDERHWNVSAFMQTTDIIASLYTEFQWKNQTSTKNQILKTRI